MGRSQVTGKAAAPGRHARVLRGVVAVEAPAGRCSLTVRPVALSDPAGRKDLSWKEGS